MFALSNQSIIKIERYFRKPSFLLHLLQVYLFLFIVFVWILMRLLTLTFRWSWNVLDLRISLGGHWLKWLYWNIGLVVGILRTFRWRTTRNLLVPRNNLHNMVNISIQIFGNMILLLDWGFWHGWFLLAKVNWLFLVLSIIHRRSKENPISFILHNFLIYVVLPSHLLIIEILDGYSSFGSDSLRRFESMNIFVNHIAIVWVTTPLLLLL